jgi:Mn2+/Fe2+ NRAMP family transporter
MRATIAYTTARILLFVAATGLLYLIGARGLLLLALALLVSGIVSYVVLSKQRDAMSGAIIRRFRSLRSRLDEGARAEDEPASPPEQPAERVAGS